ncbi:MAG: hypothetical protein IKF37_02105 [Bacilli bacterium]|nr:hypothetical protein [Bacilli bacterium]
MVSSIKNKCKNILSKENNKDIIKNIIFSFMVKGLAIVLNFFTMPAYMKYFKNDTALGVWFTVVSIINWVLMFDLGIGNGLRNKLPKAIEDKDVEEQKTLLSSAYISIILISAIFLIVLLVINGFIDWNQLLNVKKSILSPETLKISMSILIIGIVLRLVLNLNSSIFFSIQKSAITNLIGFLSTLFIFLYVYFAKVGDVSTNFIKLSVANTILSNLPLLIGTFYIFIVPFKKMWPRIKYFNKQKAKEILKIGTILLWLQVSFMIIASTHAFLITNFRNPDEVVDYNIYYKIYYGILSLFYLSLTPIWSAVTKAQAMKDYSWIYKLYKLLLVITIPFLALNFLTIPFLQKVLDIWLKEDTIQANNWIVLVFIIFNFCFAVHNVNTSIFNGLSDFKVQNIWMTFATIIFVPLCYFITKYLGNWSGVIIGSFLCVIPYEVIQIIVGMKKLRKLKDESLLKKHA